MILYSPCTWIPLKHICQEDIGKMNHCSPNSLLGSIEKPTKQYTVRFQKIISVNTELKEKKIANNNIMLEMEIQQLK